MPKNEENYALSWKVGVFFQGITPPTTTTHKQTNKTPTKNANKNLHTGDVTYCLLKLIKKLLSRKTTKKPWWYLVILLHIL